MKTEARSFEICLNEMARGSSRVTTLRTNGVQTPFTINVWTGGCLTINECNDTCLCFIAGSDLVACGKALIRLESLVGIARGDQVRVNNQEARAAKSWIPQPSFAAIGELIAKVRELVGMEVYYSLPSKNCEHYVTEWRYGKAWSVQVENLWRMSS